MVLRLRAAQRCSLDLGGPMDWKRFDRVRGNVGPVHLDLVESYAAGRINRREFMRRGAVVGLSLPMIGAVIAAVGGEQVAAARQAPAGSRRSTGRHHSHRLPDARRALDPIADAGSRGLRHLSPSRSSSWSPWATTAASHRASPSRGSRTRRPTCGRSSSAPGRQMARRHRLHVGRRRGHDGSPGRGRRTPDSPGVIEAGAVDATDPARRGVHAGGTERQPPALVSVLQRPDVHHAGRLRDRHHRSTRRRTAPGRGSSTASIPPPAARSSATRTGGAARRRSTAIEFTFFEDLGTMLTAHTRVVGRRPRAVLGDRRRRPAQQPRLQRPRDRVGHPPPDLDALRHRAVRRQAGSSGAGAHVRPRADAPARCSAAGRASATTT